MPIPPNPAAPTGGVILMVDDSVSTLALGSRILSSRGHEVVTVSDPLDVPALLRKRRPRLILLDIHMPGIDGFTLLRHIRKVTRVPVVMLTGEGRTESVVSAMRLGAMDFLTKPLEADRLIRAVEEALERSRTLDNPLRISHYEIEEEIGQGGMGVVYRARDVTLDRPVALKVILPELEENPDQRKRFLREARAAARVSHPGLVTIYEADRYEGRLFLAMEYLEGRTLRELMWELKFGPDRALDVVLQAAEAVREIHRAGLIHRDLKPMNIMILEGMRAKILDFGLAGLRAEIASQAPKDYVEGTPGYIPPEALLGTAVDERSDIYSLGVIAFELLAGRPPFPLQDSDSAYLKVLSSNVAEPLSEAEGVPRPVASLVERMMHVEVDRRLESMDTVIAELRKLGAG